MKKVLFVIAFALVSIAGYSQDVLGKWYTEAGDAQVEIYQSGDKLNGKIVWLAQGPETTDKHNPNEKLRSRKLMGVNILSGLSKSKNKWEGGKIYNPKKLDGDKLKVRGYIAMFYETQTWTRKK